MMNEVKMMLPNLNNQLPTPLPQLPTGEVAQVDARGLDYRELNRRVDELLASGAGEIEIRGVHGQRYIASRIRRPVNFRIHGTPGNDLAAFSDGVRLEVFGDAQDGVGNTMNSGEIIIHGRAGDIVGMGMRGGRIFIRDEVGYRTAIHMKEYREQRPVIVIGVMGQDFLGEYMAGGVVVILNLPPRNPKSFSRPPAFIGTGIHGGKIFFRGKLEPYQTGKEVGFDSPDEKEIEFLRGIIRDYSNYFGQNLDHVIPDDFLKLYPKHLRPYGRLYAY